MIGREGSGELYPGEASGDRMQRRSIEAIRGVNSYHDPVSDSTVQLDHSYGNAWRVNNQDAYILTKDPTFNPGQYGFEATRLKVVRQLTADPVGIPSWVEDVMPADVCANAS